MSEMTDGLRGSLGAGELAELTRRGLEQWRTGLGADAEQMKVCDCCGDWVGFEHPRDREMADQWRAAMAERSRLESLRTGGTGAGGRPRRCGDRLDRVPHARVVPRRPPLERQPRPR